MIQVILIVIILAFFMFAVAEKSDSRGVKRQVLEKQTALLIDSAEPGMEFEIRKVNANGRIDEVRLEDGRIFISADGLKSIKGYPYFSKHLVVVASLDDKFIVSVLPSGDSQ